MSLFCTFSLGAQQFGVAVEKVQEVIPFQEMTPVPLAPPEVMGLLNLRGQIVVAIDLRRRLGLPIAPPGRRPMNVVVRSEDGAVSLLVDEVGEVVDAGEETFEAPPDTLRIAERDLIRGAHKLEQGLLLILDTDRAVHTVARR